MNRYPSPLEHFMSWYEEAKEKVPDAQAMALATASAEGVPSVRMVYFKGVSGKAFTFYSNYNSRKGQELAGNPKAALLFFWQPFNRQIRVEGVVEKMSRNASVAYFNTRPLDSRISSLISQQSREINSYKELLNRHAEISQSNTLPSCPQHWGGYLLIPQRYEFYKGHPQRLNERLLYTLKAGEWVHSFLSP